MLCTLVTLSNKQLCRAESSSRPTNPPNAALSFPLLPGSKVRMYPLTTYRGIYPLLLFLYISCTLAQHVETDSIDLQLNPHSAWDDLIIDQQPEDTSEQDKEPVQQQQQLNSQDNDILSIIATTYLQPRPTPPSKPLINPTPRFNDDGQHQQQEGDLKLLPAPTPTPKKSRKRRRDQAANIFRTLGCMSLPLSPSLSPSLSLPLSRRS
ncbi:hypothetical protein BCR35DRAFT_133692 [Leucosporidium creatinivorum]|uniref:Uncharacterized protein n=1 Tax=Leucosporidium creatinivorum TaxID=106004 RepID=A0A1Y2G0G7_9BASI|nr:hypothetical protein BCR35DRAFT_133692 [Leucosporidium creatinivorum]